MSYDIYIRRKDQLYIGEVPALPGCLTLGRSEKEVIENIRDVIDAYFRTLRKKHKPPPRVKVVRVWRRHNTTIQTA